MRSELLDNLLSDARVQEILQQSEVLSWASKIEPTYTYGSDDWSSVCRMAYVLSNAALVSPVEDKDYAEESYLLLSSYPIAQKQALDIFESIAGYDFLDKSIIYYFYLSSLALKLDKTISARLALKTYDTSASYDEADWGQRTLYNILKSLLLLIRKHKGFSDIRDAVGLIETLRSEQKEFEENYMSSIPVQKQQQKALTLVAIYHVSKAVFDTADYLINGYNIQHRRITSIVRQHIDIASQLIEKESRLNDFFAIIWNDLQLLIQNSIWTQTNFQDTVKKLCKIKADNELLELLPSQQKALTGGMLDIAANAIVLQMPTSAGKTLMAEFNILVTRSLRPDAKIVYVVPSRALMNQVYFDLRDDLRSLDIAIERTSSAVEVDPTENNFLVADKIDILVCTPEKLDLLIRRNHPSVEDVSLFIIDEAHTIENGERGAKLELLITMLRRERPEARFMLLSPFLPDSGESVTEWLGGGNSIHIDWRPSEKLVFGLHIARDKAQYTILPTALSTKITEEQHFESDLSFPMVSTGEKEQILEYAAKKYGEENRTQLILCAGKKTANKRAEKIASWITPTGTESEDLKLIKKYIDEEIGCPTIYAELLSKGVAVHHAGLSDETKILTEHLIRQGDIRYVCATTTIAEGVNFPVSSVYFDTYYRGRDSRNRNKPLSSNDFWNIAGRAGRTMVDDYGKIILPFNSSQNIAIAKQLIAQGAEQLTSVLAQLFENRDRVLDLLSENNPEKRLVYEFPESFGPLFQYFVHLLNVADSEYVADVEDLFKDSLAYTLLDESNKTAFIDLCRRIYLTIQSDFSEQRGVLKFADKTGFSVPSVLSIMHSKVNVPEIVDLNSWNADVMFDYRNINSLTEKIRVVAALKETHLGTDSNRAPFNPKLASEVLIRWVSGDKLGTMSDMHPSFSDEENASQRISEFVRYMNDMRFKASWGLSALEGIVRGNVDELKDSYIPSYVYYGVKDPKSLAMRMLGVPRSLSVSLSQVIEGDVNEYSFSRLRKIMAEMPNNDWDAYRPQGSSLSGEEWKRIVDILMK